MAQGLGTKQNTGSATESIGSPRGGFALPLFTRSLDDRILVAEAPSAPASGWSGAASLQAIGNGAIAAGKSVFLLPGTYLTGALTFAPQGAARRLFIQAEPGSVTLKLRGASPHLIRVNGAIDFALRGLVLDGAGQTIEDNALVAALLRIDGAANASALIEACEIRGSSRCGLGISNGARVTLRDCRIHACDTGVWSLDARLLAENNRVSNCANNGVLVWRSAPARDLSVVRNNEINDIDNRRVGTGEYGNGVGIFRAGDVRVEGNRIAACKFSAVRVNGGSLAHVSGNSCRDIRETAIFIEAPSPGIDTEHAIVSNNIIDGAGLGISVVNAGLYRDGVTRGVVVTGNQVLNVKANAISGGGYSPPVTIGAGIVCETETTVIGNVVDGAAGPGIILGTNPAARKLVASGNIVRNARLGIGFSAEASAQDIVISANIVSGFRAAAQGAPEYALSGAIVPVTFNGAVYARAGGNGTDYGNSPETRAGAATISGNRATP